MVVYFDLLVDFVVTADELADWVLFEHAHDVAFGVEVGGVDVHWSGLIDYKIWDGNWFK